VEVGLPDSTHFASAHPFEQLAGHAMQEVAAAVAIPYPGAHLKISARVACLHSSTLVVVTALVQSAVQSPLVA
jgi:hypothetical protein